MEGKITWQPFMDSFVSSKNDKTVDELIDLIEHEPKRGGFMGLSEKERTAYRTSIRRIIEQLET